MTRPLPHRFPFPAQFPETQPWILAREDFKRKCKRRKFFDRALILAACAAAAALVVLVA